MKLRYKKGRPITSLITKVIIKLLFKIIGLPQWLRGKESTCNAGDTGDVGSISGSGRFSGGGNGNPLQYSCQENSIDRRAWQATVHEVMESDTTRMHAPALACKSSEGRNPSWFIFASLRQAQNLKHSRPSANMCRIKGGNYVLPFTCVKHRTVTPVSEGHTAHFASETQR